jgi:hypothetical protein
MIASARVAALTERKPGMPHPVARGLPDAEIGPTASSCATLLLTITAA